MKLSPRIIADELAHKGYLIHKYPVSYGLIEVFSTQTPVDGEISPNVLYVVDRSEIDSWNSFFSNNSPINLILVGGLLPRRFPDAVDCLLEAPPGTTVPQVVEILARISSDYDHWDRELLLAILDHIPIREFIHLASVKLDNPLALLDNSMDVIASAGSFHKPSEGTIWDFVNGPGLVLAEFFSPQEQRDLSTRAEVRDGRPYLYTPQRDRTHTYLSAQIWVDDRICGNIGMVDINGPFTGGQQDIVVMVLEALRRYFQYHEPYLQAEESRIGFFESLLEGESLSASSVSYHLAQRKWMMDDRYFLLTFRSPVVFHTQLESLSFLKLIMWEFPRSLVSLRSDSVVMLVRMEDLDLTTPAPRRMLEKFLKDKELHCGVSSSFTGFMNLPLYLVQSTFALKSSETTEHDNIRYYEDCRLDHIVEALTAQADLRSYCHPDLVHLWESGDEGTHTLIRCLQAYLQNGKSLSATSRVLHVHRNTLIYRLNKVSSLLRIDLDNLDNNLAFSYLFTCSIIGYIPSP